MKPIVLTPLGETMRENPTVKETKKEAELPECVDCIGIHDICGGWMDKRRVSTTHSAIFCRRCNLRVVIPATILTYGELRAYFYEQLKR